MRPSTKPAIEHYHALIEQDLGAAEDQLTQLQQAQHDRKVLFGDRPMAHSLRPTFMTESTYSRVQDVVYLIRQAVLHIAAAHFTDERVLKEELGMADWEIELATVMGTPPARYVPADEAYDHVFQR